MIGGGGPDVLLRGLRVLARAVREEPRVFAVAVGGSVLGGLVTVANAVVVGRIAGGVIAPALARHRVDAGALALSVVVVLGLTALKVAGIFCRRVGAGYLQFRLQARYRRLVTRRYLHLPEAWHQRHATGRLLSCASSDVDAIWYAMVPLPYATGTVVMLVAAVLALIAIDPVVGLVAVAVFPVLLGIYIVYSRRIAPRLDRAQEVRAGLSAVAHESFDGALVVKVLGREAEETARFSAKAGELRDLLVSVGRLRGFFDPLLDALPSLGSLAALLVGAGRLRDGAISLTELITVVFLFTVLAHPVRAIGWLLAEVPRSVIGWDRVGAVLAATGEMVYGARTLDPPSGTPATLRLDRVSFAYEPGEPVLHEVCLTVPAGRTVALVGPTGSGKSTVAALAARLADPQPSERAPSRRVEQRGGGPTHRVKRRGARGRPRRAALPRQPAPAGRPGMVTFDGVDLRELTAEAVAGAVALVPQVPFVFDDSVRANVTLDRPGIGDDAVWAALREAQADGFVASLPDRLDTAVGERGTTLSGGQRQRLTLARALAGRPRLLVLDDATSAVDARVEAAILESLRARAGADTSILVVAHRPATIAIADEVVYLEHGRVVATGTHSDLMARVAAYASLVAAYEKAERHEYARR